MSDKYSFEKAYNEAYEIRSNALESKAEKNEKEELSKDDYEKSEQSLQEDREKKKIEDDTRLKEIRQKLHGHFLNGEEAEEGLKNINESESVEKEKKPEKLYRAYAIHPDELSLEKFQETLVPMNVNEKDPTKVNDGNELGVYMSTNEDMVKSYSEGSSFVENIHIETPVYNDGYGRKNYIELPSCGVIIEVDTKNLAIKKPEITPQLRGVHNNGMSGDEWIADEIPASKYKVKKLILNVGGSDLERTILEVDGLDKQKLQEAIDHIKKKFDQKKQEAMLYKKFLESTPEGERVGSGGLYLKSKWKKYQEENKL